jgi:hypothetical protein
MAERVVNMCTGLPMHRELLGSVLYGKLTLERCLKAPGLYDLIWRGTDPVRAIDQRLLGLIEMAWSLSSLRTGTRLPKPRPIALGDGSYWLARLAPPPPGGQYYVERDDNGCQSLFEWHAPEPPRKLLTRPT